MKVHYRQGNMYKTITGKKLNSLLIENNSEVIVVCFAAKYLGESRILDQVLSELSEDYDNKASFYRIDADTESDYAADKGIFRLPTVLFYVDSELTHLSTGLQSKSSLEKILNSFAGFPEPNSY